MLIALFRETGRGPMRFGGDADEQLAEILTVEQTLESGDGVL